MEPVKTDSTLPAKRPTFLTVLCILSFVGIGLSIVLLLIAYLGFLAAASLADTLNAAATANGLKNAVDATADAVGVSPGTMAWVTLIQLLLNLPILAGVILMWKRKKLGYFIYAPLEIIQAVLPIIMGFGFVGGMGMTIIGLLFPVAFVVMYGLNLKHMQGTKASEKPADAKSPVPPAAQKQAAAVSTPALKGGPFYEVRLSNVSCTPVGATFKVGMTVTAKKFVIDSKTGKEKEETINDEIQIGMVKNGKEIYLKAYRFTKTVTALSLTLDQKPDKIGVDPYNKLAEKV
ncbi:MAG: hypothetical protein WAQ28_18315 [Bacteroidia bacterium]